LGVVSDLADRAAVMYAGQIVETGTVSDVFGRPRHPYTEGLLRAMPRNERRTGELPTIPGTVPHPAAWPVGCHFQSRCPHAEAACAAAPIPLVNHGVTARCRRVAELSLQGVRPIRPHEEEPTR